LDRDEPREEGIFVSYRRGETGHVAGRLADRLMERFGPSRVFIDVDSIEPGVDFEEAIEGAIGRSAAAGSLVVIQCGPIRANHSESGLRPD
jgi:hypothetical protein